MDECLFKLHFNICRQISAALIKETKKTKET